MADGKRMELPDRTPAVEPLPIRVVPDWNEQVERADEVCRLIDLHLDYETRGRLLLDPKDFRPQHLCPEQRVQMVSDLSPHVIRAG